jgi:hypothetical protein
MAAHNDLTFTCERCADVRVATIRETNAILSGLGLPPR